MKVNVGTADRVVRAVVGLLLLYLAFFSGLAMFESGLWTLVAAAAGVVMLGVAVLRVCPLYTVLGIKTCRT